MTLKEKINEIMPDKVSKRFSGGVLGCPYDYEELHNSLETVEIEDHTCPDAVIVIRCETCWNRPYIEPEVQNA